MEVTIKNKKYEFSENELDCLKGKLRPYKLEYKEIGVDDIAVYLGLTIIGYAQDKVIDAILRELKKI